MGYYRLTVWKENDSDKLSLVGSGSLRKATGRTFKIGRGRSVDVKLVSSSGPKRHMHMVFRVDFDGHLMVLAYSPSEGETDSGDWVDVPDGSWVHCGKRLRFCDEDNFYQVRAAWHPDGLELK